MNTGELECQCMHTKQLKPTSATCAAMHSRDPEDRRALEGLEKAGREPAPRICSEEKSVFLDFPTCTADGAGRTVAMLIFADSIPEPSGYANQRSDLEMPITEAGRV